MNNLSLNILTFPWWWYTTGFNLVRAWAKREFFLSLHQTGLLIFAKHLKEPLYGDYTKTGIIFGFFLRLVLLFYKIIVFFIRMSLVTILALLYLLLLPGVLFMIIFQILGIQGSL
jgi:hypothetical protein